MIGGATHPGKIRRANEDSFSICQDRGLLILADGMGGHNAGETASRQAVESIGGYLTMERLQSTGASDEKIAAVLKQSILHAHHGINRLAEQNQAFAGMGTTIITALKVGNRMHICHVGDSRGYLADRLEIKLLTKDHSYVMALVDAGTMSMAEARRSPLKNQLTMALGINMEIEPAHRVVRMQKGDILLLCSDGLWDMIPDEDIYRSLRSNDSAILACNALIEAANTAGGRDNITVVAAIYDD